MENKKKIVKENGVKDKNTGESLSIGDVVKVDGLEGDYQVLIRMSEGRPFLVPYIDGKAITSHKIYMTSIVNPQFEKVGKFSDTQGGFMSENVIKDALRSTVKKKLLTKK